MLSWLLSPLRAGLLLAVALWLLWRWLPSLLRAIGVVAVLAALALMTPLGANALVAWVESGSPPAEACATPLPETIVLLGGGVQTSTSEANQYAVLSPSSLRRVFAAAELARRQPAAAIVVTGDSYYGTPESVLMTRLLVDLGIDPARIREESRARTTWQNAQFIAALEPAVQRRIWLVTSALHMPRSLYAFEQAGFDACAWPTDSRYAGWAGIGYLLPGSSALQKSEAALHELVGGFAYRHGWLRETDRDPPPDSGER